MRTELRKFPHRFQLRLALVALLGLLTSQWGAMSHAYSHDATAGTLLQQHHPEATGHDPCSDCLAYAPLLAAGAAPSPVPFSAPQERSAAPPARPDSLVDLSLELAFRSRAPPRTP
jgi:hypothetical protein